MNTGDDSQSMIDAADLDAVLFDFDGVLTDNRVVVFEDGREAAMCSRADGLAFDFLRRVNMPVHILSTETNPVVKARATKLKVDAMTGLRDKVAAVTELCGAHGYSANRLMFVGNDINDLPVMAAVGFPVAVADSHAAVLSIAWRVLETSGGAGVAREIVERVIRFDQALF
jgi:3-deoxy-D-manno-octulosonate 8-phosphate phosphatase (KDO 8-P phosphatase)